MPAFTFIATAIVSEIIGGAIVAGTWAAFAVSVVATGLAVITSRLIGGVGNNGGSGVQNQGVRIQLPPATENKVPVIYGKAFQQGIITDAQISNENKTMHYVLTLSEKTQTTSTYTVGGIYWNDQKLNYAADGYTVESSTLADGTTSTNLAGLVKTWVWAGGSSSTYQVFGPSTPVNAYDIIPDTSSTYLMSDLVFAVMQVNFDQNKGVTSLPPITFEITNSLKNPGEVWYDYMTSTRYGAGFAQVNVDTGSSISTSTSTSLYSVSNQIPANQYLNTATTTSTTTSSQVRYEINGIVNTVDTVKTNLDKINLASASWTTYDHKLGQWRVVPNKVLSAGELAALRSYDDDTIVGDITLTSTNLEDIYNQLEVTYANRGLRDQSDYFRASIAAEELNALEPVNVLRMQTALCNNGIHAARIGLIELKQSRIDKVITFQTDYSGLQTEAGDVIKVTNSLYGFNQKLFRVTRVRETEGQDGALAAEINALEYDADVYTDETLYDGQNKPFSDIFTFGASNTLLAPGQVTATNVISTGTVTPRFTINTVVNAASGPVDEIQWFVNTSNTTTGMTNLFNQKIVGGNFAAGSTVSYTVTNLNAGTYYFAARSGLTNAGYSNLSTISSPFTWTPNIDFGGI